MRCVSFSVTSLFFSMNRVVLPIITFHVGAAVKSFLEASWAAQASYGAAFTARRSSSIILRATMPFVVFVVPFSHNNVVFFVG